MRRMGLLVMTVVSVALLGGCAFRPGWFPAQSRMMGSLGQSLPVVPVQPPPGFIYEQVSAPLSYNFAETPAQPGKTGVSQANYLCIPFIPYLSFSWGDVSIENAAREGNLDEVAYADYEVMQVLGVFTQMKIIAHGR
ncbi:MAG TPA: TRL domain-containing protein [Candidatus Sumerlaeota bacterium]|nr:MAG: hypothetical protein BWZ08_02094 [candidate division BRC1 bacterium ADurb.BinA292]HPK03591.1 TRL domain-containing protein [Candidatus Sumerlaeota bacterium]